MTSSLAVTRPTQEERLRDAIYEQIGGLSVAEATLDHGYARLGILLAEFKRSEAWRPLGYKNFDQFMSELHTKFNRGRTQSYAILSVAEKLAPMLPADVLDEIGISKAQEIKRALKVPGRALTPELIMAARNPKVTIKELRAKLADAFHIVDDNRPAGQWFDFSGAYLTTEERALFVDAVKMTAALLGLKKDVPDHIQRKEVILAWASEFMGTHAAEVYGPEAGVDECGHSDT